MATPVAANPAIGSNQPTALILVHGPQGVDSGSHLLQQIFGLTPAEARLTRLILEGRSPGDAAIQLHVSVSTIRTQLSAVLKKTGAQRQSDLVRRLSPLLVQPLGISLPIYPAKGYSVTMPVKDEALAHQVSLTDDEYKLVFSRLGNRLRIAGTAELNGYDRDLNRVRCEAIVARVEQLFPGAGDASQAQFWTGLRPATPDGTPIVGGTAFRNLFLNTGHGTLGWTMAAGTGRDRAYPAGGGPRIPPRRAAPAPRRSLRPGRTPAIARSRAGRPAVHARRRRRGCDSRACRRCRTVNSRPQ